MALKPVAKLPSTTTPGGEKTVFQDSDSGELFVRSGSEMVAVSKESPLHSTISRSLPGAVEPVVTETPIAPKPVDVVQAARTSIPAPSAPQEAEAPTSALTPVPVQAPQAQSPMKEKVQITEEAQLVPPALIKEYEDSLRAQQNAAQAGAEAAMKQAGAEVVQREVREQELAQSMKRQQDLMAEYSKKKEENEGRVRTRIQDLQEQKVDPQRFFKDRGNWDTLAAGLAIAAGAYASALTGGENAALRIVNSAIDRDIDAQKSELAKKKDLVNLEDNLYAKEMAFYNDAQQAEASVRLTQLSAFENRLQNAVAKSQNPIIAANAKRTLAGLQQQAAEWKAKLAPKAQQVTTREAATSKLDPKTQLEASHQIQKNLNDNQDITSYRSAKNTLQKLESSIIAGRPEIATVDFVATYLKQGSFGPNLVEILKAAQPGVQNVSDAIKIELGKGTSSAFVKDLRQYLKADKERLSKQIGPQVERLNAEAQMAGYRGIEDFADLDLSEVKRSAKFDEIAKKTGKKVK